MNQLINAALESRWKTIHQGLCLVTPDNAKGSQFYIEAVNASNIVIKTDGGTLITIKRNAFEETLRYLLEHKHTDQNRCPIGANKNNLNAGPLCIVARNTDGTMIISYLLPILAEMNLVGIDGNRPNKTWLV
jgi:hypothetical protein